MSKATKYIFIGFVALFCWFAINASYRAGYSKAKAQGRRDMALLQKEYANKAQDLENKYREQEKINAQKLASAIDAIEKEKGTNTSLLVRLRRLRNESQSLKDNLSRADNRSVELERTLVKRGIRLHERGAELLTRLTEFSTRSARKNDTLILLIDEDDKSLKN